MSREESAKWFEEVVPALADLLLRFPSLLRTHYQTAYIALLNGVNAGLCLLRSQEPGMVLLSQELIGALLGCSLFCLFPVTNRGVEHLPTINFDHLFAYASSFHFTGDYVDKKDGDCFGRRKTRIIAIDALCSPRMRQYKQECLLRETNKAFCGFFAQSKYQQYKRLFPENGCSGAQLDQNIEDPIGRSRSNLLSHENASTSDETTEEKSLNQVIRNFEKGCESLGHEDNNIGIVTGNWGCGAFGGDPELKAIIQWLAASQALRPFISYYTFGLDELQNLDQVTRWILSQKWTVGDLWNMLVEYSYQKYKGQTDVGFFTWLLPSLFGHDAEMLDLPNTP